MFILLNYAYIITFFTHWKTFEFATSYSKLFELFCDKNDAVFWRFLNYVNLHIIIKKIGKVTVTVNSMLVPYYVRLCHTLIILFVEKNNKLVFLSISRWSKASEKLVMNVFWINTSIFTDRKRWSRVWGSIQFPLSLSKS